MFKRPFGDPEVKELKRKVIPTFSEAQIQALLNVIDRTTSQGARDWTMLLILLDTGVRVSELINLEMEDVNLDGGMIKVYGKGIGI